jgi:DNA mismatch endonuclease (patch repair protein)
MADVHSKEKRSFNMSRIRSKNTKPELTVRRFLFSKGFRFRIHVKELPGKPDIVLPKYRLIIFVQGCFWHNHQNCSRAVLPKSNQDYWRPKLERNISKDLTVKETLEKDGWTIYYIWECSLKTKVADKTLEELVRTLKAKLIDIS